MTWPIDELPFLRRHDPDQVQRVQPHRLSQPGLLAETGHPSDVIEAKVRAPPLSSRQRRAGRREMRGFAEALAIGLAHQLLEVRHQGAGDGPRLVVMPVDRAHRHDLGSRAAEEYLAGLGRAPPARTVRSSTDQPRFLASPITARRVMPSRKFSGVGVTSLSSITRKMLAPVDSARSPFQSSIRASSKPAFRARSFSMPQMM